MRSIHNVHTCTEVVHTCHTYTGSMCLHFWRSPLAHYGMRPTITTHQRLVQVYRFASASVADFLRRAPPHLSMQNKT